VLQIGSVAGAEVFCKNCIWKGKILCFPLQSQKVFDICLAAGLGEGLAPAQKWVQQLRNGDWVTQPSCHGPEERMASFDAWGI